MLDERKLELVTMIMSGENKTDVAKRLNITRKTVYTWLDDPEVKSEIEKRQRELKQSGKDLLTSRLGGYLNNLHSIAMTSKDTRTKAQVNEYLVDRVLGKASAVGELENNDPDDSKDIDIESEIAKMKECFAKEKQQQESRELGEEKLREHFKIVK